SASRRTILPLLGRRQWRFFSRELMTIAHVPQNQIKRWMRPPVVRLHGPRWIYPEIVVELPSRPREFHPEPLTEPDLILSHHPARAIARRPPPSVEPSGSSQHDRLAQAQRR